MSKPHLLAPWALTLKNPWAHLIAHAGKDVENRSWMPPEQVDQVLIHAGKSWDEFATASPTGVVTSAIVAVADLAFACHTSRFADRLVCGCGRWAMPGQCHWKLGTVWPLARPVPATGRQGLWRPPTDVLEAVRAQFESVSA